MEGATYSNFEMKFKWSFCFLFLGYCDDKDSIMEQWRVQLIQIFKWRVNEVSVFLFLGYCDDIIDSIIEQHTKNEEYISENQCSTTTERLIWAGRSRGGHNSIQVTFPEKHFGALVIFVDKDTGLCNFLSVVGI